MYDQDGDFAIQCRMITALAFVPPVDVIASFEELSDNSPVLLQPVLDYIEDYYIGRLTRRGLRRQPLFPIELWNMYDRALNGQAKTTNAVEAWHRALQSLLSEIHPSIWKFINGLKRLQKLRDTEIEQSIAGEPVPKRRRVYECLKSRISDRVRGYNNQAIMDYLSGVAHNLS